MSTINEDKSCCHKICHCIPTRATVAVMMFMANFTSYVLRLDMAALILLMVDHKEDIEGPKYDYSDLQKSLLSGGYFMGYVIVSLPAGVLAEHFGGRYIVEIALVICALFTVLTPLAAQFSFGFILACQIAVGLGGGLISPSVHALISKWAPTNEKGKFVATFMGGTLATIVTWPICLAVSKAIGWVWVFQIEAVLCILVAMFWQLVVYNRPDLHPRITPEEVKYIEEGHDGNVQQYQIWPPASAIFKSPPFYGFMFLHVGNLWGLFFMITTAPTFLHDVLDYSLEEAADLGITPFIARLIVGLLFGFVGDHYIQKREPHKKTILRKAFTVLSHIIPGMLLLSIAYIQMDRVWVIDILVVTLGLNGVSVVTCLQNPQDLSPNFAGTLYGIVNFVGAFSGFLAPLVVAYCKHGQGSIETYSNVFLIGASFYIIPAVIFMFIGSAEVQPWNEPPQP